jgi:hypothetical protein
VAQVRRAALVVTALVLLSACSGDDADIGATTTTAPPTTHDGAADSTTESTTEGPTTAPGPSDLALRGDGLGVVQFGAAPDDAVAAVVAELGDPAHDTGWEPSFSSYGTCPGERIRGVEWGGLVLLFTDGDTAEGSGEHFFTWRVDGAPPAVATSSGLGWGATAQDAEELYPHHVERVPAEEPFPAFLDIDAEGGPITAYLDESDAITNLEAGTACGE